MRRWSVHRWVVLGMTVVVLASLAAWWSSRGPLPRVLRIATAQPTGLYHKLGGELAERLRARTRRKVELVDTAGSIENAERLAAGDVDLAVLQATALREGTVTLGDVAVLAPLYPEVLHVIVRADSTVREVPDLFGRAITLGPPRSGMRESARVLLDHYRIGIDDLRRNDAFFGDLATDSDIEGAIVTTGLDNPGLCALLDAGEYRLIPILDAGAIAMRHPFFKEFTVPRGFFDERPAVPDVDTPTVATTAVLAARKDASSRLVREALGALYERDLRATFPHLIPEREALAHSPVPIHPTARSFLDPYGGIDIVAAFIESISGIKELLVGLVALIYLGVDLLRRLNRRGRDRELAAKKNRLDEFLQRTLKIERAQMETEDPSRLREYLREVTRVKIEAIEQLTEEELRADQAFQIFLMQCANLSRKIQGRLSLLHAERGAR